MTDPAALDQAVRMAIHRGFIGRASAQRAQAWFAAPGWADAVLNYYAIFTGQRPQYRHPY